MKIGILITGHPPEEISEGGRYDGYFQRLLGEDTFDYATWSVVDGEMPENVRDADGWLITGSKHGAYEPHDWIPPLETFIRDSYANKVPMIGVCFGHQIIAQAMGGKVEKFEGGWSIGRHEYCLGDQTLAINAWHQDQVVEKPATAEVFASTDFCANAGLLYDDRIWTIQPHPEFGHDFIDRLLTHRTKGVVPVTLVDQAQAELDAPLDQELVADQMRAFFKKERA